MARLTSPGKSTVEHPFLTWVAAGMAATALLGQFEWLERLVLGEEPPYAPARIAERLLGDRRYGPLLRWTYGPALGVAYGAIRSRFRIPALAFGAAVAAAEAFGMPRVRATPRLAGKELVALFAHAAAFAVAAEAALRQAARRASRSAPAV